MATNKTVVLRIPKGSLGIATDRSRSIDRSLERVALGRRTARLLSIDTEIDFCGPGGRVDQLGEDYSNTNTTM